MSSVAVIRDWDKILQVIFCSESHAEAAVINRGYINYDGSREDVTGEVSHSVTVHSGHLEALDSAGYTVTHKITADGNIPLMPPIPAS
jgi:hypothetical protein